MGGLNIRDRYQFDPSADDDEGGGLSGMLLRAMQQQSQQSGALPGSAPDASPATYSDSYGNPQGGLLGRLLALQAQQNQLFAGSGGQAPSEPANPDIRKLTRVYITPLPRGSNDASDQPDDQSGSSYSLSGDSNSFDGGRQGNQAAQSDQSFSDWARAYWDHPHPYGVVSAIKSALNGMALAVQSSKDATRVPTTEEEVFRQDLGRKLGPIGAWQAVSVLNPTAPGGTGGIFARPLVDSVINRGLPLRAAEPIARQAIDGPIANAGAQVMRQISGNGSFPLATLPGKMAGPRGSVPLVPPPALPQMIGGLSRSYSDRPALPWIPAAPAIQAAIEEIQAGRKRRRFPLPPPTKLPGFLDAWLKAEAEGTLPYEDEDGGGSGGGRRSKKSGGGGSNAFGEGDDDKNPCLDRWEGEYNSCPKFKMPLPIGNRYKYACEARANDRLSLCYRNGGPSDSDKPSEFSWKDIPRDPATR